MEHGLVLSSWEQDQHLDLPPGFRFHPTDEELMTHYLSKKVVDGNFKARAIGEVDLNKCEPWDLPWRAKMGEKEWYFFCVRDRKYPTGLRTNRATESGYWKATGKDKEIHSHRGKTMTLVGMKKTLVFYKGRAPKGEKSNWVMHEYRLEGKYYSLYALTKKPKNEWVICRVFHKSSGGKINGHVMASSSSSSIANIGDELLLDPSALLLPPLLDPPPLPGAGGKMRASPASGKAHVTCFSNAALILEGQKSQDELMDYFNSPLFSAAPPANNINNNNQNDGSSILSKLQLLESHGYDTLMMRRQISCKSADDREISMVMSVSQETGLTTDINPEISSVVSNPPEMPKQCFDGGREDPSAPPGPSTPLDDCLWNY